MGVPFPGDAEGGEVCAGLGGALFGELLQGFGLGNAGGDGGSVGVHDVAPVNSVCGYTVTLMCP
ncbi:hypothetical protein RHRU231_450120 [Rhodococcus ruber]|uniref:Uncharacterized protein n=1 Tax=Rhodococcus ruber TaxID=1830 RepID=A0A098BJT0_9NOCA|nr:hypothetical protein RHRU231_450120 [Rhodococcus ruber]